jgi:hypothetical protein
MKWQEVNHTIDQTTAVNWLDLNDLGDQLEGLAPTLDTQARRLLAQFAHNGLPLILTWDRPITRTVVERLTGAVIVESMTVPPSNGPEDSARLRVAYVGFNHDIALSQVVAVKSSEPTVTFYDPTAT